MSTVIKKTLALILAVTANIVSPQTSFAEDPAGIRTDFGDVLIENLGIGRTYNLRDLAGVPLKVTNTGMETVDLLIDVHIPTPDMIVGDRKGLGYRPIPKVDWVEVSQSQFIVPSKESAYTDVLIKIPDDPSLYGKKFQASIYSRTTGKTFLNLGVWSHLLLTIVQSPETQTEMEKNRKRGVVGNMDYTLVPDKIVIVDAPIGRAYDIAKENKKTIKMANSGSEKIQLQAKVVGIGSTPLSLQSGYEEGDPSWIQLKSETFDVEPDTFVDPGLILSLPNKAALSKKKFMFVLKVDPANPDVVGVTFYGKIYVEVK